MSFDYKMPDYLGDKVCIVVGCFLFLKNALNYFGVLGFYITRSNEE